MRIAIVKPFRAYVTPSDVNTPDYLPTCPLATCWYLASKIKESNQYYNSSKNLTTSEPPKKLVIKKIPPIERKPQIALKSVTNSEGEVFQCQDQIRVKAPWGSRATAEIIVLYQDESGNPWAQYKPNESDPKWDWEGGCIRAERLRKA